MPQIFRKTVGDDIAWEPVATFPASVSGLRRASPHTARDARLVDVDGDGLDEYFHGISFLPSASDGSWRTAEVFSIAGVDSVASTSNGLFLDTDGDGLVNVHETIDDTHHSAWQKRGQYFEELGVRNLGLSLMNAWNCTFMLDFNGDGLVDRGLVQSDGVIVVQANQGQGRFAFPPSPVATTTAVPPCYPDGRWDQGVRPVDYNQDGRDDILLLGRSNAATAKLIPSNGDGFGAEIDLGIPLTHPSCSAETCGPVFSNGGDAALSRTLDVNGDGLFDVLQMKSSDASNPDSPVNVEVWIQQGSNADLLVRVENGFGAITDEVQYKPLTKTAYVRPQGCAYPQRCYLGPRVVVTAQYLPEQSSGEGSPAQGAATVLAFQHSYIGGRTDAFAGWLGFESHTTSDVRPGGGSRTVRTTYDQNTSQTLGGTRRLPFRGMPVEQVSWVTVGDRTRASRTATTYQARESQVGSATTFFVFPSSTTVSEYESSTFDADDPPAPFRTWISRIPNPATDVDDYGNVKTIEVDRGADPVGGSHQITTTATTFLTPNTSTWLIGLTQSVSITSQAAAEGVATQSWTYAYEDDDSGRLKSVTRDAVADALDAAQCTSIAARDMQFGLPTRLEMTPNGCIANAETRLTQIAYDADGVFTKSVTNPLGHTITQSTHPGLGVAELTTDASNNLSMARQYDGFGRLRRTDLPNDTWETITLGGSAGFGASVEVQRSDDSSSRILIDKLGRVAEETSPGFDGSTISHSVTYDEFGRLKGVLRPRYLTEPAHYAARYQYDELGRVTAVCQDDATKCRTSAYSGLVTDSYSECNTSIVGPECRIHERTTMTPSGAVAETTTFLPLGALATTRYVYGPFGNLKYVTDAQNNVVKLVHDGLGRLRKLDFEVLGGPEDVIDVTTDYNAFDEEISQTIPRTYAEGLYATTTTIRDKLGRVQTRVSHDGTDTYLYDNAPGAGVGKVWKASRQSTAAYAQIPAAVTQEVAYDAIGRPTSATWDVDGELYRYSYTYDRGRLATTRYPEVPSGGGAFMTQNVYNAYGYLAEVRSVSGTCTGNSDCTGGSVCADGACHTGSSPGNPTILSKTLVVDAEGHITQEQIPGAAISRSYDASTGRLLTISTPGVQSVAYEYFDDGNLRRRSDSLSGLSETFHYDESNRLWKTEVENVSAVTTQYDSIGNAIAITFGADGTCTRTHGEGPAGPHALTSASCCGDAPYDERGNVIFDACLSWGVFAYNTFNKPRSIELPGGQGTEYFAYDSMHERVRKKNLGARPAGTVWDDVVYVGDLFERRRNDSTDDQVHYIYANNRLIGQFTKSVENGVPGPSTGWHFLHQDRLGSIEVATSEDGTVRDRMSYSAWGTRRNPDGTGEIYPQSTPLAVKKGFTGHEMEDEFYGLVNMGGRIYNPVARQFLQPDPIVQDPGYGPSPLCQRS
jgi:RHS repeat-associated protein